MKFSIRFADQIVGAFIILALVILVFVIFMLGKSQRWFARDYLYKTYFTSAEGLNPNMPVLYKGFTVGHVKKINLSEDDRVEVFFTIFDEHIHRVREGSLVEAQVSPVGLGSKFIFSPGRGLNKLIEGTIIPSVDSPEGLRLISQGLAVSPEQDSINAIMSQVNLIMSMLENTVSDINEAFSGSDKSSIGRTLGNVEMATSDLKDMTKDLSSEISGILAQLDPILANVETLTDKLADPNGTVMSILDTKEPIYNDLVSVFDSIAGVLSNLEKISDFIPSQLPQIAVLVSDLHTALKSAEDLMTALLNNPLLKGGVPEHKETGPGGASPRDLDF